MEQGEVPRYPSASSGSEHWLLRPLVLTLTFFLQTLAQFAWCCLMKVATVFEKLFFLPTMVPTETDRENEGWQGSAEERIYSQREGNTLVTVQTSSCAFQVELEPLMEHSEYFRALADSCMRETSEHHVLLEHIPSEIFRSMLDFIFHGEFQLSGEEDLLAGIEVGSYLLCRYYIKQCCRSLRGHMSPNTCVKYLQISRSFACEEMLHSVHQYLSDGLLELTTITRKLGTVDRKRLVKMREQGIPELCMLRKESLGRELSHADFLCRLPMGAEAWSRSTRLPFKAEKWNISVVVLWNYLFLVGGYQQKLKRSSKFRRASFRYNPILDRWDTISPMCKRRRHFSLAAGGDHIFAIGGWYLLAPVPSTRLYSTVERYDPWTDAWALVASMPLTDFSFSLSLLHDLPLCAAWSDFIYVLGSVQRTSEKLVMQYDTRTAAPGSRARGFYLVQTDKVSTLVLVDPLFPLQLVLLAAGVRGKSNFHHFLWTPRRSNSAISFLTDTWQELLPTLTRTDAEIPFLYFLGGSEPLYMVGGNYEENLVVTFSVDSQQWGEVRRMAKCSLAGQGTNLGSHFFMPAPEINAVLEMDVDTLSTKALPPPPRPLSYEALFFLWFPLEGSEQDCRECLKIAKAS